MHHSYERLFSEGTEDESGTPKTGITNYGILLYVRTAIEWTGLNIHEIMEMPVIELFNLTLFNMDWNSFKEQQMKQMMKKK